MRAPHPTTEHEGPHATSVSVVFDGFEPVRFARGPRQFRVTGTPKCADINGVRYWRVRAVADDGATGTFDLRGTDDGWVLDE